MTTSDPAPDAGPRPRQIALRDVLAGVVFVAFGLAFALIALTYDVGTTGRMGPGSFPLVLGIVLVVLGAAVVVKGFVAGELEPIGSVPWRGLALILGAVIFFGLTVRGLGLVPAVLAAALLSAFASVRTRPLVAIAIAVFLTVLCILVFVVALRLRVPLFGPWIPI